MLLSRRTLLIAVVIVIIPIAAIAWWLISPLFIDKSVDEEFPFAFSATIPTNMTRVEVEQVMSGIAKVDSAEVADSMTDLMMKATGSDVADASDLTVLGTGSFRDADSLHKGSGTATIYEGPDGTRVLRLEDFRVTNGPDLHVILSPVSNPLSRDEVTSAGYVDLGSLKGNVGNQNYVIPNDVEIPENGSIVIYCMPFHVIFSVASLQDGA